MKKNKLKEVKLPVAYSNELLENPKYSLSVDPKDEYGFPDEKKLFIALYLNFDSVATAAELADVDVEVAKKWYIEPDVQSEINRIKLAMHHHQFANKIISIEEIGGYLSSLLTDYMVPEADKLKSSEKLKVAQMLIDLNVLKTKMYDDPAYGASKDIEVEIRDLSIDTIKSLLKSSLSKEDIKSLKGLKTKELFELLEDTGKGEK